MRRELVSLAAMILSVAACAGDSKPRPDTSQVAAQPEPAAHTDTAKPAPRPESTATTRPAPASGASATPAESTGNVHVSEHGIGPVKVGMTLAEARTATAGKLSAPPAADTAECGFARWQGGPSGVRMMTAKGRIARVDVDKGGTPTVAGARIGDSETRISTLYPGRVEVTPHKYTRGHYLTIKPATAADGSYRIIFETDGSRVTRYRAGRLPEVSNVEGCG